MAQTARTFSTEPDLFDQRVFFHGVSWEDYQRLVEMRGDEPSPRMTYIEGTLEIMTPSTSHESFKTRLARLIEAWSEEMGVDLDGVGSWTLRNELAQRGLEPDECYFVGPLDPKAGRQLFTRERNTRYFLG